MPIKPVDFQVMIPRTVDAAKMKSDEMQKQINIAQQQASAVQSKAEDTVRQVYSRSKTEEARINEKQKEERQQQNSRSKKRKGNGKDHTGTDGLSGMRKGAAEIRTSTIDIKI